MTYSLDLRQKALAIKTKTNLSYKEIAKMFEVSERTLNRWKKRIEPIKHHKKHKTKINIENLLLDVEKYPDAYLTERAERLGVSKSCVGDNLKKLNISYKKKPKTP